MALNRAYNQYKENSVFTSTPEELTLMLYNGLVKFIMQAQAAMDGKNMEKPITALFVPRTSLRIFKPRLI